MGRPKGLTRAATAVRDVQICRLLARGMTMREVAEVFGISATSVFRARDRQVAHLNMRIHEREARARRVERRGRPRKADAERNRELFRQAALKVMSGRKPPTEREIQEIQQSMDRNGLREVVRRAIHAIQSADDEGEGGP